MIVTSRVIYPRPEEMEDSPPNLETSGLPRVFWLCLIGAVLVAAGFTDFSLAAFHFVKTGTIPGTWIPIFYSIAMGCADLRLLVFGRLFDRQGVVVLVPLTAATAIFTALLFLGGFGPALVGMALWGLGIGFTSRSWRQPCPKRCRHSAAPPHAASSPWAMVSSGSWEAL